MEDQYGMANLRQHHYMNERPHFPPTEDLFSGHRNLTQPHHHHYQMVMLGPHHHHHHEFQSDSVTTTAAAAAAAAAAEPSLNGLEMEGGGGGFGGDGGGTGRWPRQETLTLLEIRSRLDSKFKESNQKGPLWDEVSRIMSEENGYQRSGKKCREKFENLYKYYKKTREGKAGRQDGKHYRFFRQLEALYGDTRNPVSVSETHLLGNNFQFENASNIATQPPKLCDSLSLSNSSEFDTSSSDDYDTNAAVLMDNDLAEKKKKRRGRRSWKAKIRDFIELQMSKIMEKQEEFLENMVKTVECKEQERMSREEEWRKEEVDRIEREHKFWANERAWIKSRDSAIMEALKKLTEKEVKASSLEEVTGAEKLQSLGENQNENGSETITNTLKAEEGNKKRKENSRSCYFQSNESTIYNHGGGAGGGGGGYCEINGGDGGSNTGNGMHDSCFRFLVGSSDGDKYLWENYGVKLNKG
ncbi:trihelix transcription factor PTL-like [Camellia sinensis]|nr:trihelix transcription factor PTL-like [Camellia sinensis]